MDRLAGFCAFADHGSIAKAARGDPNAASLISRQIRELEMFFGVELVRRRGRGLELTKAGIELAVIGRQNFKGIADFAGRCRGLAWSLRIVASNSVAQWLLLPRLGALLDRVPGVRCEIHHAQTQEMIAGVREGVYDLGFIRKDALDAGLKSRVLGEIGHSVVIPKRLSPSAPKSAGAAMTSLPMALPIGGKMRESVDRIAARNGGVTNVKVACSSYLQAAQLVAAGVCAAALPDTALVSLRGLLVHRLPLPDRFTLCLVWTARNADTRPALADLIEAMQETMRL